MRKIADGAAATKNMARPAIVGPVPSMLLEKGWKRPNFHYKFNNWSL
jgi:hypothetical protein